MSCVIISDKKKATISSRGISSINGLLNRGLICDGDNIKALEEVDGRYKTGISAHIAEILAKENNAYQSPVGMQYLPNIKELEVGADEISDPIGDEIFSPVNGIVHRYPDRVLLKLTNICAVNCRYCFRKEMTSTNAKNLSEEEIAAAISYINQHKKIWEVVLTGGDPLVLSYRRMKKALDLIEEITHIRIVRIHTRIPVADPLRIDNTLLSVLKNSNKTIQIVVHINHVKEITKNVESTFNRIKQANCSIFSQSVLLKGVNDSENTLEELFRNLNCMHVKPYYLHHLDKAKGTSHFRVPLLRGMEVMKNLHGRISGTCLPKYMLDIPGGHGKVPVNESYVRHKGNGVFEVEDYQGYVHLYLDNV